MKKVLAAALLVAAGYARATSVSTDFTDMWFKADESGWGVNVTQNHDTIFVTMFVYGPTGQPAWYVATATLNSSANGTYTFSGPLYTTTGPYFGTAWNGNTGNRQVGTLTFTATGTASATLSYTVDGTPVSKSVVRETLKTEDIAGTFLGGSTGTWSNCGASRNGYQEAYATYTITQDNASVQIHEEGSNYFCNYTGNYAQDGRMGRITGNGLCSDGINQAFTATEVLVSTQSLTMRFATQQIGGCTFTGRFGGVRRVP